MFTPSGPTFWELAEQALSSTERGYDLLAPKFDATPFCTPSALLDACERYLSADPRPGHSLDVCCGTGAGLAMLRRVTRTSVTGLDFSRNMLEQARQRVVDMDDVVLIRADARRLDELPELQQRFDCVTCFGALGHIRGHESKRFLEGLFGCLVPGGRLVLVTFNHPPVASLSWLAAHAYNALTRARNLLIKPAFHMYYLSFTWPLLGQQLRGAGFRVDTPSVQFAAPFQSARLVIATRPSA